MPVTSSQVRFAALIALRNSIGIFVATVLLVPTYSVINCVFRGTWYVNWRLMLVVSSTLTFLVFVFFFVAELLEITTEEARKRRLQFVFPVAIWERGLYLGAILMGFGLMAGTYREGDSWWVVLIPVGVVFLGFFAWPRAIEILDSQVRQRQVLFQFKRIPFHEIESIVFDPARSEVVVFGKNGARIVHTMMHVDGDRFIERLEEVTGKGVNSIGEF